MDIYDILTLVLKSVLDGSVTIADLIVIIAILRNSQLRSNPTMLLIVSVLIADFITAANVIVHDVPSVIVGYSLYGYPTINVIVALLCVSWFGQLFLLPIIACVHLYAVIEPLKFRQFSIKSFGIIIVIVLVLTAFATVPLYFDCCGFVYYINGNYWSFDYSKTGTAAYDKFNLYLQIVCFVSMLAIDIVIIFKVNKKLTKKVAPTTIGRFQPTTIQVSRLTTQNKIDDDQKLQPITKFIKPTTIVSSVEMRMAKNFLMVSVSFFIATIVFNIAPYWSSPWAGVLIAATSPLMVGKCLAYALNGQIIRSAVRDLIMCKS